MNTINSLIDSRYLKICFHAVLTVLVIAAIGLLAYTSSELLFKVWELACAVAEPFAYGLLMCYLLLPAVRGLSERLAGWGVFAESLDARIRIATALTVAMVALAVCAVTFMLVLVITRSIESVNPETIQGLLAVAEGDVNKLLGTLQRVATELGIVKAGERATLVGAFGAATNVISRVFFSMVFGIYFLLDGERVFKYAKRVLLVTFDGYQGFDAAALLKDADDAFSGYIRGQLVDAVLVGVLASLVLTAIGVPYGPLVGLVTGIGNLIPYVGGPMGYATMVLACFAEEDFSRLLAGVVALSVIMLVDANIINPRLLSHAVEVHPLVVFVAIIAGNAIGGLVGMVVAVPLAAFIKVRLDRWLVRREESISRDPLP